MGTPGRREHRKRVTRSELLAAGRRLFGEKGLYEPRIEDLTSEAGIAKGTLYGYFANKEELIQAVVAQGLCELLDRVRASCHGARAHEDLIARVVRAHADFFAENPDLMRVFHQVRGMLKFDRPEWRPLRLTLADYLMRLAQVLKGPADRGVSVLAHRQDVARILFGAISGVTSVRAALSPGSARLVAPGPVARAIVRMVLAYEVEIGARVGCRPAAAPPGARRAAAQGRGQRTRRRRSAVSGNVGARPSQSGTPPP